MINRPKTINSNDAKQQLVNEDAQENANGTQRDARL